MGKISLSKSQDGCHEEAGAGKKKAIEGGEQRWIAFKYERLLNFCYRCGLLNHGLKDCPDGKMENLLELPSLQYGAWLRGEVPRRGGDVSFKFGSEDRWHGKGGPAKGVMGGKGMNVHAQGGSVEQEKVSESQLPYQGDSDREEEITEGGLESRKQRGDHERGKEINLGEHSQGISANLVKENRVGLWAKNQAMEGMHWEKETKNEIEAPFEFRVAPKDKGGDAEVGLVSVDKVKGPMAMSLDDQLGWVAEELGPKSGHWKRLARMAHGASPIKEKEKITILGKRPSPIPIQELESSGVTQKRRKNKEQSKALVHSEERDGGEAMATKQHRRAS